MRICEGGSDNIHQVNLQCHILLLIHQIVTNDRNMTITQDLAKLISYEEASA